MFLTRRFFTLIALIAITAAAGYWLPVLYDVARGVLAVFLIMMVADFAVVWTLGKVHAERTTAQKFCLGEDNRVSLRIESEAPLPLHLTIRDELPAEFRFHNAVFHITLRRQEGKNIHYALHPVERGAYGFGHILVFVSSPIGLVERKLKTGEELKVKVYPAFRHLDRLELVALGGNAQQGQHRIRRPGAQTEFEHITDYVSGDDFRTINWKATARANRFMVNTYQAEKSQPIICIIDKGRAMQRTWGGMTLLDYSINAALALSYVCIHHDDMAGLITFSHEVETYLPASRRSTQLPMLMEALYAQSSQFEEADYSTLRTYISRHVRRRSLLVLYTDFPNLDAMNRQLPYLRMIARDHPLLVVFFRDEEVEDASRQHPRTREDYVAQTLAHNFQMEKNAISSRLSACGIYSQQSTPASLPTDVIHKHFEPKQRGII